MIRSTFGNKKNMSKMTYLGRSFYLGLSDLKKWFSSKTRANFGNFWTDWESRILGFIPYLWSMRLQQQKKSLFRGIHIWQRMTILFIIQIKEWPFWLGRDVEFYPPILLCSFETSQFLFLTKCPTPELWTEATTRCSNSKFKSIVRANSTGTGTSTVFLVLPCCSIIYEPTDA